MRRYKLFLFCLCFFVFFASFPLFGKILTERLRLFKTIPSNMEYSFFKFMPPSFDTDSGGHLYFPLNFKHIILKVNHNGKIIKKIGRKGKGPGDLYLPFLLKIHKNKMFVVDNNSFSLFTIEGVFIRRFRYFSGINDFTISDNKIYASYIIGKEVVKVFDFYGKKLFSFADLVKINNIDYGIYRNKQIDFEDLTSSKITSSCRNIFLLFPQFGTICKYDTKGSFLNKKIIYFDDPEFDKKLKRIRNLLIGGKYQCSKINLQKKSKCVDIWLMGSIQYYNKKLYISVSSNFTGVNKAVIFQFNKDTFVPEKKYVLYAKDCNVSDYFLVKKERGKTQFLIPVDNYKTGYISIGVFK